MSDSLPRRSSSPKVPGAERSATMQTALEALLSGSSADPVRRALGLDALDRQLRPLLPQALAPHVRLANVAGGRLVMLVDSPVWHAGLRWPRPSSSTPPGPSGWMCARSSSGRPGNRCTSLLPPASARVRRRATVAGRRRRRKRSTPRWPRSRSPPLAASPGADRVRPPARGFPGAPAGPGGQRILAAASARSVNLPRRNAAISLSNRYIGAFVA